MLVLKRKSGQALMIGEDIYIKIVTVDGDKVKIAIEAPQNIDVFRTELLRAQDANREASKITPRILKAFQKFIQNEDFNE